MVRLLNQTEVLTCLSFEAVSVGQFLKFLNFSARSSSVWIPLHSRREAKFKHGSNDTLRANELITQNLYSPLLHLGGETNYILVNEANSIKEPGSIAYLLE